MTKTADYVCIAYEFAMSNVELRQRVVKLSAKTVTTSGREGNKGSLISRCNHSIHWIGQWTKLYNDIVALHNWIVDEDNRGDDEYLPYNLSEAFGLFAVEKNSENSSLI